jgi:hypothetical protein
MTDVNDSWFYFLMGVAVSIVVIEMFTGGLPLK